MVILLLVDIRGAAAIAPVGINSIKLRELALAIARLLVVEQTGVSFGSFHGGSRHLDSNRLLG